MRRKKRKRGRSRLFLAPELRQPSRGPTGRGVRCVYTRPVPPLRRPETTKAFTYFALFNFIAVQQITNFYSCFIVVETEVQKSDFPKVTQLVSDGAGIYAQFDYQASLLSHHQNRSEFPHTTASHWLESPRRVQEVSK